MMLAIIGFHLRRAVGRWNHLGYLILLGVCLQAISPLVAPALILSRAGSILAGAAGLLFIAGCLVNSVKIFSVSAKVMFSRLVAFLLSLVIAFQVEAVVGLFVSSGASSNFESLFRDSFDAALSATYLVTTAIVLALTTEWVWYPIVKRRIRVLSVPSFNIEAVRREPQQLGRAFWQIILILAAALGAVISTYQWLHGYPLAGDSDYYISVLRGMNSNGAIVAFSFDRPLFFLFLFGIERALKLDPVVVLRLMSPALAVVLTVLTFYFVKLLSGRLEVAGVAAVLTAVSPHVTVGSAALLIANWLGLCLLLLLSYAFLKIEVERPVKWLVVALLSVTLLGVHIVTWLFLLGVMGGYTLISLIEKENGRLHRVKVLAALAIAGISCAILIASYSTWARDQISLIIGLLSQIPAGNFITFFSSQYIVYNYFGVGHYATPVLYLLGVLGYTTIASWQTDGARWLKSWFIVSCIGFFAAPYAEWWRLLYFVPLEILAALGLLRILVQIRQYRSHPSGNTSRYSAAILLIMASLLAGLGSSFSMIPFAFILPIVAALMLAISPNSFDLQTSVLLLIVSLVLGALARAFYVMM